MRLIVGFILLAIVGLGQTGDEPEGENTIPKIHEKIAAQLDEFSTTGDSLLFVELKDTLVRLGYNKAVLANAVDSDTHFSLLVAALNALSDKLVPDFDFNKKPLIGNNAIVVGPKKHVRSAAQIEKNREHRETYNFQALLIRSEAYLINSLLELVRSKFQGDEIDFAIEMVDRRISSDIQKKAILDFLYNGGRATDFRHRDFGRE